MADAIGSLAEGGTGTDAASSSTMVTMFAQSHAIEAVSRCGAHAAVRLWAVSANEFIRVVLRVDGVAIPSARATTLFYARPDLAAAAPGALGLTVLLSDSVLGTASAIEILLISVRNEVLVVRGAGTPSLFPEFLAAILYDVQRTGRSIEQRLLFDRSYALLDMIQAAWTGYVDDRKQAVLAFGKSYRPATHSLVTVFYRKPFLAGLHSFMARILDLPPDAEIILCFQQAPLFQQQIDYLEGLFRQFQINHKFLLFEDNVGFSAANNAGVSEATGRNIVLVNPDICCNDPGVYRAIAEAAATGGIVGSTLLSDADEIMHNGIEFLEQTVSFRSKARRVLRTSHVDRHMSASRIEEGGLRSAEAVSGAIFAFSRGTWDRLGGLPEDYVFAHFEDVAFCLAARAQGLPVSVYQTRKLIHLESYGSGDDAMLHAIKQVNSAIFNRNTT